MTRIWWVRHGPTHQKVLTGWRDVPADLSDQVLVDRVAAALPQRAPIGSSDLLRAHQTAEALKGPRSPLPPDPQLREFDFGAWDGMRFADVATRDPELSRAFWEKPGHVAPPGGESWNDLSTRIQSALPRYLKQADDVILVAHFGVILTEFARARSLTPYKALAQPIRPLSITRIIYDADDTPIAADLVDHIP